MNLLSPQAYPIYEPQGKCTEIQYADDGPFSVKRVYCTALLDD